MAGRLCGGGAAGEVGGRVSDLVGWGCGGGDLFWARVNEVEIYLQVFDRPELHANPFLGYTSGMTVSIAKLALVSSLLLGIQTNLSAAVIFENVSPFFGGSAPQTFASSDTFWGTTFVADTSGSLDTILFVISNVTAGPGQVTVGLYGDQAGQPGLLLESWTFAPPTLFPLTSLPSTLFPVLSEGDRYWFLISDVGGMSVNLIGNDLGIPGGFWSGNDLTGLVNAFPARPAVGIRVSGRDSLVVPEPDSLILGGLGLFLLAALRQRPAALSGQ